MNIEKSLKELLIHQIEQRLNKINQKVEPLSETPPEMKILSYGMTIGYIDIVTEKDLKPERIEKWKNLVSKGEKLILLIPKEEKLRIADMLWKEGLAEKVSIGTFEINLFLP